MRSLRLRDGAREGRAMLGHGLHLIRRYPTVTIQLGIVLSLFPALLTGFGMVRVYAGVLPLWDGWLNSFLQSGAQAQGAMELISLTLSTSGRVGLGQTLLNLAQSLILSPLLLSALALLYNGFIETESTDTLTAIKRAGLNVRNLVFVAIALMLANWIVQMLPSVASGILTLLAELLSWIPILGTVAYILAIVLSLLISLLTDFAVTVIFCYVWICAACEGVPGFGALVRSWQLTRNAMHETIASLIVLTLLRWLTVAVVAALWLVLRRLSGIPIASLIYLYYGISAVFPILTAAVTSALYQRRPVHDVPRPGQFKNGKPDLENMKSANLDG